MRTSILSLTLIILISCGTAKQTAVTEPPVQRIPAKFDFSPPNRSSIASTGITIAIVKPVYVGENPEYYVSPFNEMATSMGNDFEEMLTAKGFSVRGPYGSRDEMVYSEMMNTNLIMEIGIDIKPQYSRKYTTTIKTNWGSILDKNTPASTTYYHVNGEITLAGNLVINAKSARSGILLWKKNIALQSASFVYAGTLNWNGMPTMAEELNKDNQVYNTVSKELQKFYLQALDLAWRQIDPTEMKAVAEQAKKAEGR